MRRTLWAEKFSARFASVPLVAECVFLSPKRFAGLDPAQREVCDLLIALRGQALVVQMKSQEQPHLRSESKLERWVRKNAAGAARQVSGSIRTLGREPTWCDHPRRGRTEFRAGELTPVHAIVVVETPDRVGLRGEPLSVHGVPVSYLSLNDFLHLLEELRAFPEIVSYLDERTRLPEEDRAAVGGECILYARYLQNEGGFAGWTNFLEMQQAALEQDPATKRLLSAKHNLDRNAHFVELVADRLATRLEGYQDGLQPEVLKRFDPLANRTDYLLMQEELCDLTLVERRALGDTYAELSSMVDEDPSAASMMYRAYPDERRDRVYVISASRGVSRGDAITRAENLLLGALAFYRKERGIAVVGRQGETFEVMLAAGFRATPETVQVGEVLFGSLRVSRFVGSISSPLTREGG